MEVGNLIARFFEAVVWPATVITLALLFRKQISYVVETLSRLKWGDAEAEFGKTLKQAETKATDLDLAPRQVLKQDTEPITLSSSYDALAELASKSPRTAVLLAWMMLASAIDEAGTLLDIHTRSTVGKEVATLLEMIKRNMLPAETKGLYDDLRGMKDDALHDGRSSVSTVEAFRYVDLTLAFIDRIQKAQKH